MTRITFEIENEDVQATAEAMMEEVSHWGDTSVKIVSEPVVEDLEGEIEDLTTSLRSMSTQEGMLWEKNVDLRLANRKLEYKLEILEATKLEYAEFIMSLMEGDTHMIERMMGTLVDDGVLDEDHELIHLQDDQD